MQEISCEKRIAASKLDCIFVALSSPAVHAYFLRHMKNLASILVILGITCLSYGTTSAQTKVTQLVIANSNGNFKLNGPTVPASGSRSFDFPASPTGSKFVMSASTTGQTISGDVTFTGAVTFGDELSLTFGGSTGNAGDVLTSDGFGGASWQTPSGGGGGGVPTTRTLTTTSPLTIGGGSSADLSANRTIAIDFSVANEWTGTQTFPLTLTQGNLLINSINAGDQAIGVARGGTGQTSFTDGQLLIGNSTGNTLAKATLTAGSGIQITNGNGSITISGLQSQVLAGRTTTTMGTSGTRYYHPASTTGGGNTLNALGTSSMRMPRAGTLQNLFVDLTNQPGVGKSRSFNLTNVTTGNSISAVITGTGTSGNSGASTLTVNAGDIIVLEQVATSTTTDGQAVWSFEFL